MENKDIIQKYIQFKSFCIEDGIIDINEIIKLFEVWLHI
jgi:hypothetical protein